MVLAGDIEIIDIERFAVVLKEDNPDRVSLWNLYAVSGNIAAWKRTQAKKRKGPPPGWKSGVDEQGRRHVWSWEKGEEIVYEPSIPVPIRKTTTHSPAYVPMAPNERLVKRPNREGYGRDFFLDSSESRLTDRELDELMDMAGSLDLSPF
jgi:hypothetical protein